MSGLMQTQCSPDGSMVEGIVMSVDVLRHSCEIKTNWGNKLTNVQWMIPCGGASRTGSHTAPTVGDKVIVNFSLSYPIIIGFLPRVETITANPVQIDTGLPIGDCGNLSSIQDPQSRVNPGRPEDMALGDHVWTSEGGGIMGLLRGGTVLLRASRLAQIIISKFDDIVRIVGRNYELFTDTFIDVSYNLKGRIYRFTGYSETHAKVRDDNYSYREYKGDVALAEYAESNGFVDTTYAGTNLPPAPYVLPPTDPVTGYPLANLTINKIKIVENNAIVYEQVFDLNGHNRRTNYKNAISYIDQLGTQLQYRVTDGGVSTITQTGVQTVIDQNETSTVTLHGDHITLNQGPNQSTIVMTNSSITATFAGGGSLLLNGTQARLQFGSHYININAAGVQTV